MFGVCFTSVLCRYDVGIVIRTHASSNIHEFFRSLEKISGEKMATKISKKQEDDARLLRDSYMRMYRVRHGILEKARADIPQGWREIDQIIPKDDHKEKVTLYVEKHVLKYLRGDGVNWQERVRLILREYVKLQIGKVLQERDYIAMQYEEYGSELDLPNPYGE